MIQPLFVINGHAGWIEEESLRCKLLLTDLQRLVHKDPTEDITCFRPDHSFYIFIWSWWHDISHLPDKCHVALLPSDGLSFIPGSAIIHNTLLPSPNTQIEFTRKGSVLWIPGGPSRRTTIVNRHQRPLRILCRTIKTTWVKEGSLQLSGQRAGNSKASIGPPELHPSKP